MCYYLPIATSTCNQLFGLIIPIAEIVIAVTAINASVKESEETEVESIIEAELEEPAEAQPVIDAVLDTFINQVI